MNSAGISLSADGIQALIGTAPDGKYCCRMDCDYNHHIYGTVDKKQRRKTYDYTALLLPNTAPTALPKWSI